jgi:hypothetical protein
MIHHKLLVPTYACSQPREYLGAICDVVRGRPFKHSLYAEIGGYKWDQEACDLSGCAPHTASPMKRGTDV